MEELKNAINQMTYKLDEVQIGIAKVEKMIDKKTLEDSHMFVKLQNIIDIQNLKLDMLSGGVDSTARTPAPPTPASSSSSSSSTPVATPAVEQSKASITQFFISMWLDPEMRKVLYDKNVITDTDLTKIMDDNKDKLTTKKSDALKQRAIGTAIWKSFSKQTKEIVYSLKDAYANECKKQNSSQIAEEEESKSDNE